MEKMREEFEAWYEGHCAPLESDWFKRDSDFPDDYEYFPAQEAWAGWQASRAALQANSCAGMDDPAAEIAELKRQRDELIDEFDQIMKFYDVDSVSGLIRAQEEHILRLQESAAKKSMTRITVSSPVRSA